MKTRAIDTARKRRKRHFMPIDSPGKRSSVHSRPPDISPEPPVAIPPLPVEPIMKTYRDIFDLQVNAHTSDWTPGEKGQLTALAAQAHVVFWKTAKRENQNTVGFRNAVAAIANSRRVNARRLISFANLQYAIEIGRELEHPQT